ncbi:MAG: AI-2E family transporter [Chitinophagaceae bacterium]|nr:AI-2E family transporter [Chitinophagaceae bacterium]
MPKSMTINTRVIQLFGLFLLATLIYVGSDIIIPLGFAFLLSILLLPVYRFFLRLKFPNFLAIILSVILALALFLGLLVLLFSQLNNLMSDLPKIQENVQKHISALSQWIEAQAGFSTQRQGQVLNEQVKKLGDSAMGVAGGTAASVSHILIWLGLLPLYIFLILYYKNLLLRFLFLCSSRDYHTEMQSVIYDTEKTLKSYLTGLLIEMLLVALMNGIILSIIGIKYSILIAVIFAIMNLLPYIGAIIANILAALITLATSDQLWHVVAVLGVLGVVQFIDNNIIMPYVVGSKVRLNALVTIVGLLIGQALAGVGGMFLAIPSLAVLKVVFDRIDGMKHWGVLLGDETPKLNPLNSPVMRLRNRLRRKVLADDPAYNPPGAPSAVRPPADPSASPDPKV